jgi:hypothetical protein
MQADVEVTPNPEEVAAVKQVDLQVWPGDIVALPVGQCNETQHQAVCCSAAQLYLRQHSTARALALHNDCTKQRRAAQRWSVCSACLRISSQCVCMLVG